MVGSDTYPWGRKDFHKCWSGSLAKRRLCLGPDGVINYTPLCEKKKKCMTELPVTIMVTRLKAVDQMYSLIYD